MSFKKKSTFRSEFRWPGRTRSWCSTWSCSPISLCSFLWRYNITNISFNSLFHFSSNDIKKTTSDLIVIWTCADCSCYYHVISACVYLSVFAHNNMTPPALPSVVLSQKQVLAVCRPAPFFCMMIQVTGGTQTSHLRQPKGSKGWGPFGNCFYWNTCFTCSRFSSSLGLFFSRYR